MTGDVVADRSENEGRLFRVVSDFRPAGDQPEAIRKLVAGLNAGAPAQVLMGVTGSGKTFTMAEVIAAVQRPTLIISHNKTLAAQLFGEFRSFFPDNAVEYFVSYYDYYQPEAYIPQRDIYIEKDSSINENIDRLRLAATSSLLSRRDVVIVASVSSIYGLGSPEEYSRITVEIARGTSMERDVFLAKLVEMQYQRNDVEFKRGMFRVRGDVVEVIPSYMQEAIRVCFFGDEIEGIMEFDPLTGEVFKQYDKVMLFPAKHYVVSEQRLDSAVTAIRSELVQQVQAFADAGKIVEAQRINARTKYDLEMMAEVGYCSGIENYSRHLEGRAPGERPSCLMDYFPDDFLVIVDESHATVPQVRGMYNGDRSRKTTLVEHGFRLPSALDNRPMKFDEFESTSGQVIYVSATPGPYELERTHGEVVEQLIRPTGLVDPVVRVESAQEQVKDVVEEVRKRIERGERTLLTTLTKRFSEDLTQYMVEAGIKVQYLHSEVETIERVEILKDLRKGVYDAIVGVNLLREGLDLPEVSLVAILDADKEGFLRSETSLIQTIGRAARNVNAEVILYADKITPSMRKAMDETDRRRKVQADYNKKHGIVPKTIIKKITSGIEDLIEAYKVERQASGMAEDDYDVAEVIRQLEEQMYQAAEDLEFELAAKIRDRISELQGKLDPKAKKKRRRARI